MDTRIAESAISALERKAADHDFVGPEKCAWREIPSAYILCEQDCAFPSAVSEAMIEQVKSEGAKVQTARLKGGHAPMLSIPRETGLLIATLIEDSN